MLEKLHFWMAQNRRQGAGDVQPGMEFDKAEMRATGDGKRRVLTSFGRIGRDQYVAILA